MLPFIDLASSVLDAQTGLEQATLVLQSGSGEFLKASTRGCPSAGFNGDSLPYNNIKTRGPQPWDLMPDDLRWS